MTSARRHLLLDKPVENKTWIFSIVSRDGLGNCRFASQCSFGLIVLRGEPGAKQEFSVAAACRQASAMACATAARLIGLAAAHCCARKP